MPWRLPPSAHARSGIRARFDRVYIATLTHSMSPSRLASALLMPTGGVTRWSVSARPLALSAVTALSIIARPSPSQELLSLLSTCTIHHKSHSGFDLGALPQFSRASSRLTTELSQAVTFISMTVTLWHAIAPQSTPNALWRPYGHCVAER